jgi:UDP-N-acetylmuramate dehydrogenase
MQPSFHPTSESRSTTKPVHAIALERLRTHDSAGWLRLEDVEMEENVSLAPLTTLKLGGPARFFARVTDETELLEAVGFARGRGLPLFVLGGGSNLVVSDAGFAGMVVALAIAPSIVRTHAVFEVSAGTDWNEFVLEVCWQGFAGVECLAGIPGLVGGAPIQNIGAYGQEVAETVRAVRALDLETGAFVDLAAGECEFAYRRSIFNSIRRGRYIVTRVDFALDANARPKLNYAELQKVFADRPSPTPMEIYDAVREIRAGKGMLIDSASPRPDERSAGSFFKNPVVTPKVFKNLLDTVFMQPSEIPHWPAEAGKVKLAAAWLIEQSGFKKGFALGRVGISSKHTLALINRTGDARCADLLQLRDLIVLTVEQRFGVTLEQEPVLLR